MFAVVLTCSCGNEDSDEPVPYPPTPPVETGRTVLVYQVANRNGLSNNSVADINEMRHAAKAGDIGRDGRLVVYNHRNNTVPMLLEIKPDGVDTLKTYDTSVSSASSTRMQEVLADINRYAPARQYGLILWGHGSGWLQDGREDLATADRSFGGDNGQWMNVSTLARVLSQGPAMSFLYFDCCYMASIEVAYELGTTVPLIAASAMEIAAEGMPYQHTVKHFFSDSESFLTDAASTTFDYYNEWRRTGSRPECSPLHILKPLLHHERVRHFGPGRAGTGNTPHIRAERHTIPRRHDSHRLRTRRTRPQLLRLQAICARPMP